MADYKVRYRPVVNKDWELEEVLLLKSDEEPKIFRRTPNIGTRNETVVIPESQIISLERV